MHVMLPMAAPGISAAFIIAFLSGRSASRQWWCSRPRARSRPPPVIMALIFQRYITRLNIVDPVTVRD